MRYNESGEEEKIKSWKQEDAYDRIIKYCNFQERSIKDVRSKLLSHGIYHENLENLIIRLVEENAIDESRYATSFARGKFKYNHWGKKKITAELKYELIPASTIAVALSEIDEVEYVKLIKTEIKKKLDLLKKKETNTLIIRKKVFSYMVQKGFSFDEINSAYEQVGK